MEEETMTHDSATVIHAGTLIDGTGGEPLSDVYISIADATIQAIDQERPVDSGQRFIDASAHTVLPGLIDCHVHLCFDPVPDPVARMNEREGLTLLRGVRNA